MNLLPTPDEYARMSWPARREAAARARSALAAAQERQANTRRDATATEREIAYLRHRIHRLENQRPTSETQRQAAAILRTLPAEPLELITARRDALPYFFRSPA